jgi:aromatic-L-amino-acid decarboxylase
VYASEQAHSSVEKAARIAGLAEGAVRLIPTDESFAMDVSALQQVVEADVADGLTPCMVTATVGTTGSNAIDPVADIAAVCAAHGIWLHVDAAMSGTAAVCPEFRWIHEGLEQADSYCFNPHKWMFTNFDCDCFYVADRRHLLAALSILPEYLRNPATDSGAVIDYRDWQIPLGRRFRALKLWFVIRHYGVQGLQHHVRRHVALAQEFAEWVRADPDWDVVAPAPLNLVCIRHRGGDERTGTIMERVNSTGRAFVTHTRLDGRLVIRVSIGQTWTERRHVAGLWEMLQAVAREAAST